MEDLYDTFGSFGPLASAKILYPRDDDRKRDHLCGFIAFMTRKDTERAIRGMQGRNLKGSELRLSLAKPVNIPPQVKFDINLFWYNERIVFLSGLNCVGKIY